VTLDRDDDIRFAEKDAAQADLRTVSADTADELDTMTDEEAAEAVEIRAEIEETRMEMGGTLNELGDRLDPATLMDQAKENVREATIGRVEETAKGMSDMVMETIKRNPIPSALAGAGLLMLWKNREKGSGNGHSADRRYDAYYGTTSSYGQRPYGQQSQEGIGQKVGDAASTVGDTARGAVGQVGQTVGQVGDNVGQTAGQIGQNVGQTAGQIGNEIDRFMQSNPLAVGAIALGAGALVGSLVPETSQEREMLGDASRQVSNAVRDTVDQAATKAEETMDKAEDKVSSPA
jgi:ElaB/YqjD/DUF883 family membrane-anchored ribosome-binding protein